MKWTAIGARMLTEVRRMAARTATAASVGAGKIARWWRRLAIGSAPLYLPLTWFASVALLGLGLELLSTYIAEGFDLPGLKRVAGLMGTYQTHLGVMFLASVALFGFSWLGHRWKAQERTLQEWFGMYAEADDLRLADLGFWALSPKALPPADTRRDDRPFFGTYFPRTALDDTEQTETDAEPPREYGEVDLAALLREGKRFLLLGPPYSGKTLTLFQVLRMLKGYTIISPDHSRPLPDEATFALLRGRRVVILLDNLAALERSDYDLELFAHRIDKVTGRRCGVAGTCREGGDFAAIAAGHGSHVAYFSESLQKMRLRPMTTGARVELAETAGMLLDPREERNYPLPGNITMRLWTNAMVFRFATLPGSGKDALRAMKLLDSGGIPLTVSRLQAVLESVFGRSPERYPVEEILSRLWDEFFLLEPPSTGRLQPHFGHLLYAVSEREDAPPVDQRWDSLAGALEAARDVEALLHLSSFHRRQGEPSRILQILDRALRVDPDHPVVHFGRGYALARQGRLDEALQENGRALDLKPDFPEALNNRCYILTCRGQLRDALEAADKALALRPDYDDAHTNRASVLAQLGRFQEAQEALSTALGLQPESYYAYLHLGITLSRQDKSNEALVAFEQALRIRPRYVEAHIHRGLTLSRLERFEEALADFSRALELRPNHAPVHLNRGQTFARMANRFDDAMAEFARAIELRSDYAEAYMRRGQTRSRNGYFREALSDFDQAIALRPHYGEAFLYRGLTNARLGRLEEALADANQAIALRAKLAEAHGQRGRVLSTLGRYHEALPALERAVELRPSYQEAHVTLSWVLAHLGRHREALQEADIALTLDPRSSEAYFTRGYALRSNSQFDLTRLEQALAAYDQAIRYRPDYVGAHRDRGYVLGRLGFREEALSAYDRSLELAAHNPGALLGKARMLCLLARQNSLRFPSEAAFSEAVALLERAVELDGRTVSVIDRDDRTFRDLKRHPVYGRRLEALVRPPEPQTANAAPKPVKE